MTTIVDTVTNKVEVINTQVIKPGTKPHIQVIPSAIVHIAEKKFTEIKEIKTTIESSTSKKVTFDSITVKDLEDVRIYTPIITMPSIPGKTQYVFVYNKKTKEVKKIEEVTIEK